MVKNLIKANTPQITVLMPVYNGEKYLRQAVDSILNQTFKDFEFLIINDGSTDKTLAILQEYKNKRVKIINNKKNIGLTKSLNKGLKLAKGKYIARMDADDISLSNRLRKQIDFLDKHNKIGVLGTQMKIINNSNKIVGEYKTPLCHSLIVWNFLFDRSHKSC